jgi:hypothetical protein
LVEAVCPGLLDIPNCFSDDPVLDAFLGINAAQYEIGGESEEKERSFEEKERSFEEKEKSFEEIRGKLIILRESLGIPPLIDATDMIKQPDDLSLMAYISYFRHYANRPVQMIVSILFIFIIFC